MHLIVTFLISLACFLGSFTTPAHAAWFSGDDTLVTIEGEKYSAEEFKRWWGFWKEEDTDLPETPEPYVDWLILAREGKRMELDEDPGFKRQTRIFLQARGLLKLKYDEVDSQIEISDEEVKSRYKEKFVPRWYLERLEFKDEDAAVAAWEKVDQELVSVAEIMENPAEYHLIDVSKSWVRPHQLDEGWIEIFEGTSVGELVDPEKHNKGYDIFYLKNKKGAEEEDLASLHERIEKDLWKEKEDELTKSLIDSLIEKYEVEIHEERLEELDLSADPDTFTDTPVISSNKENVSEKEFMAVIERLVQTRPGSAHALADETAARELKKSTAWNIVAQSVTNWESLDRHYEEKEPFKWIYQFNYNHRLVKAAENLLFGAKAKVSDEEIKKHYEENLELFTQPAMVKLYIIDDTQVPVQKVWAEVASGKDFAKVVQNEFEVKLVSQNVPLNHLDPEVKTVAEKLVEGESSRVFEARDSKVMVHVIEKTPAKPLPFGMVKESIQSKLEKDKLLELREDYLRQVKSQIKVDVQDNQWQEILEDLEESHEK